MTAVTVNQVSHAFGKRQVLQDVSFAVPQGRVTMLLGPNGAGKTTLFSLIAGLLAPQSGSLNVSRKNLGLVFQQSAVDLELTVAQNLAYYASLHGLSKTEASARIEQVLGPLELSARKQERVKSLNGGHRRRVEIARALLTQPQALLLDEPTTGLDIPTRKALVAYLHSEAEARNMAVLWSTHLVDEVEDGDHIVMLRQGKVVADGEMKDILQLSKSKNLTDAYLHFAGGDTA